MAQIALPVRADAHHAAEYDDAHSHTVREILPSGLTSMVFHIVLLLVLAMWLLPEPEESTLRPLLVRPSEPDIKNPIPFSIDDLDIPSPQKPLPPPTPYHATEPPEPIPTPSLSGPFGRITKGCPVPPSPPIPEPPSGPIVYALPRLAIHPGIRTAYSNRSPTRRRTLMKTSTDCTPASQEAVEAALRWLAAHQNADGSWSYDHRHTTRCACRNPGSAEGKFGSTALALLAFLGAGETHETGKYKRTIARGLLYLVRNMQPVDDYKTGKMLDTGHAGMYAHGLAAMALAEAYGMTQDRSLQKPAQAGLNWIINSQAAGGFWGYTGGGNDTSISGWQVMALKSGSAAGLEVPDKTIDGIRKGLDSVAGSSGAYYGYRKPVASFRPATTAIGLLSRMYTGWPNSNPALGRGMTEILKKGPDFHDMYYTYYATQAMYQYTSGKGIAWRRYSAAMRDGLIATQARAGHEAGSWNHGRFNSRGGRIYSTSLAAMCLEIYYRYEPIYQKHRTFSTSQPQGKRGFAGSKRGTPVDKDAAWELE